MSLVELVELAVHPGRGLPSPHRTGSGRRWHRGEPSAPPRPGARRSYSTCDMAGFSSLIVGFAGVPRLRSGSGGCRLGLHAGGAQSTRCPGVPPDACRRSSSCSGRDRSSVSDSAGSIGVAVAGSGVGSSATLDRRGAVCRRREWRLPAPLPLLGRRRCSSPADPGHMLAAGVPRGQGRPRADQRRSPHTPGRSRRRRRTACASSIGAPLVHLHRPRPRPLPTGLAEPATRRHLVDVAALEQDRQVPAPVRGGELRLTRPGRCGPRSASASRTWCGPGRSGLWLNR
jgi:hypothetical protein